MYEDTAVEAVIVEHTEFRMTETPATQRTVSHLFSRKVYGRFSFTHGPWVPVRQF